MFIYELILVQLIFFYTIKYILQCNEGNLFYYLYVKLASRSLVNI